LSKPSLDRSPGCMLASRPMLCVAVAVAVAAGIQSIGTEAAADAAIVDAFPNGAAAGDVDQQSAVLWARAGWVDDEEEATVLFQYGTDECFRSRDTTEVPKSVEKAEIPAKSYIENLEPGTQYFYRACNGPCPTLNRKAEGCAPGADPEREARGRFRTPDALEAFAAAHAANGDGDSAAVRFGASSCAEFSLLPFASLQNVPERDLDFFVHLGDSVYADRVVCGSNGMKTREDFRCIHNITLGKGATATRNIWAEVRQSTPLYATFDDHEVRNNVAGGATPRKGRNLCQKPDACTKREIKDNNFINDMPTFEHGVQAFQEYHPIREETWGATGDNRTRDEPRLYRYRTFGTYAALMILDARSFRDKQSNNSYGDGRTMLGAIQYDRLRADLEKAEKDDRVTWKFVMLPEPIQHLSPLGVSSADDRFEGYAHERDKLLEFIDKDQISNVVFISGDIHGSIVNNLMYREGAKRLGTDKFSYAWEVSTGPIAHGTLGEVVEHVVTKRSKTGADRRANARRREAEYYKGLGREDKDRYFEQRLNDHLEFFDYPKVGLCGPGIDAELLSSGYLAVNTFGWTEFEIDADSEALTVTTYGVAPYSEADTEHPDFLVGHVPEIVSQFSVKPQTRSEDAPNNRVGCEGAKSFCSHKDPTAGRAGRRCSNDDDCCDGDVCNKTPIGRCVRPYTLRADQRCSEDRACRFDKECFEENAETIAEENAACREGCVDDDDPAECRWSCRDTALEECSDRRCTGKGLAGIGKCEQRCGDGHCDGDERCGDRNVSDADDRKDYAFRDRKECHTDCGKCEKGQRCREDKDCAGDLECGLKRKCQ